MSARIVLGRLFLLGVSVIAGPATAAQLQCNVQGPFICISSFVPGQPGSSEDIDYDVPAPFIEFAAEAVSIVFTLPVGLDPVTPGTRSVVLLNRPGGPSGPVGEPSDFITLTALDPVPELGGLTQTFEIFFQSENAPAFEFNVPAVQSTGAPEIVSTDAFQDLSGALLLDTSPALRILVGSEGFGPTPVPEPASWVLFAIGSVAVAAQASRRGRPMSRSGSGSVAICRSRQPRQNILP